MRKIVLIIIVLCAAFSTTINAVAFKDGEKLTFAVKYGMVSAGEATVEAKSSTYQGHPVWYLSTNAKTYGFFDPVFKVRDKVESWVDKETLLPYKFSKTLQEGKYHQYRIHTFDQQNKTYSYQRYNFKTNIWKTREVELPFVTQDVLSAFYYVRSQTMKPGDRINVDITSDGKSASTYILVHRREELSTIFGRINCLVIEPKLKGEAVFKQSGRILIWLTDDNYRIPVKMESAITLGSFVAKLSDAENVPYIIKYPTK